MDVPVTWKVSWKRRAEIRKNAPAIVSEKYLKSVTFAYLFEILVISWHFAKIDSLIPTL